MRKLFRFGVNDIILKMFYESCILSVLSFCLTAWGGNNTAQEKKKIDRCLKSANKMLGRETSDNFDKILDGLTNTKINKIIREDSHPLCPKVKFGRRSGRTIHLKSRTARYFNSFLPSAIRNFSLSF